MESEIACKVYIETIKGRNYGLDIKNPHKTEDLHEYTSQEIIGLLEQSFSKGRDLLKKLNAEMIR
jgi:type I restriction enzyme M protein